VTLLVAVCLPAGCGVLALIMVIMDLLDRGRLDLGSLDNSAFAIFLVYGPIVSIFPAAFVVLGFRRILRWQKRVSFILAVVAAIWDASLLAVLLGLGLRILPK
jgi:hypothetical protein